MADCHPLPIMIRIENPVIKHEFKIRLRIAKVIPAIALRCACLGFIFVLVLLSYLGKGLLAFILAETLFVLLFVPADVCRTLASRASRNELRALAMTRTGPGTILLGKSTGAIIHTSITFLIAALVMLGICLRKNLNIRSIVFANITLLAVMLISGVTSLLFSVLFRRNVFISSLITYILILLLAGSVIIPGPLLTRIQEPKTKAVIAKVALYINPLVMTSRALGSIDIMRTRYMYILADPIVAPGFTYPDWRYVGVLYSGISCLLLIPVYLRFRFVCRTPDKEIDDP